MIGSFATKAREAVDRLREAGWAIGLVRPRLLRPYPEARLRELLAGNAAWRSSTRTCPWARAACCLRNWLRCFTAHPTRRSWSVSSAAWAAATSARKSSTRWPRSPARRPRPARPRRPAAYTEGVKGGQETPGDCAGGAAAVGLEVMRR